MLLEQQIYANESWPKAERSENIYQNILEVIFKISKKLLRISVGFGTLIEKSENLRKQFLVFFIIFRKLSLLVLN